MYPIALAVFMGLAVAFATDKILSNIPVLQKVPFLGKATNLFPVLTLLVVWATDTSILGTYGMGGAQWVDVVGSAFAIVATAHVVDVVTDAISK